MRRHVVAKGPRGTVKSSVPAMRASHNTGNISSDSKKTIDNQPEKFFINPVRICRRAAVSVVHKYKKRVSKGKGEGANGVCEQNDPN